MRCDVAQPPRRYDAKRLLGSLFSWMAAARNKTVRCDAVARAMRCDAMLLPHQQPDVLNG